MTWLLFVIAGLVISFGFVVFFGAPYLPTLTPQVATALRLAQLKPGQHLLELGCGDGKVLVAAARQGIKVTGYELNPLLVVVCWLRTRHYRKLVTVRLANFWNVSWPAADAVFTFLLPKYMQNLDTKIGAYQRLQGGPVKLVSFAFAVPNKVPQKTDKGVFLYEYDA